MSRDNVRFQFNLLWFARRGQKQLTSHYRKLTSDQNIYIPGISQNKNTFLHTLEKKKAVPSKIISHNSH